jgi:hypothetical protein
MLRLLDTLAHLLSPLTAAIDQEFGTRSIAPPPQPSEPPAPQPRPTPLPEPEPQPATSPTTVAEPEPEVPVSEPVIVASATPEVAHAEPLYVRRGAGRGARYDVATPDAEGQRYRRQVVGGRRRFTPVEAMR